MKRSYLMTLVLVAVLVAGTTAAHAAGTVSDATLTLKVKLALLDKLGTDGLHVDVDSNSGVVHLTGTVHKRATSELAATVAKSVGGVSDVTDDIEVEAAASGATGAMNEGEQEVKDAILASKVRLALVDKLGSDGFEIGTDVASGVVTLELPVTLTTARRSEAMTAALAVTGVKRVLTVDKH